MFQMEVVCLNSQPVFDEGDESEDEGDCTELGHTQSKKELPVPTIGLEFDSFDETYDFYNVYAKEQGFGIRVSNSWFRSKRKERYRAKLSCSSAGFKKKSEANHPRPETRTGCPAMIVIKLVDSKRWRIVEAKLAHNHPVSPEIKRFYKSHKKMSIAVKQAETPVQEVHTIKLYRTSSGCNGYTDVGGGRGSLPGSRSKHLELKEGDAHAVYNFFCRMKLTSPNFFYLMDLDDEGHLRNVFWADSKSRVAYNYFYDTVSIDTTSLMNKNEVPLVSFIGVNHHGDFVLLGCAFLGDESVESFVWVFKAWLTSMMGRPPQVILTDRSDHFRYAVSEVFPESRHCYCLWYIMQRVPEKLGGLSDYKAIRKEMRKAVYDSLKIFEFETCWSDMIKSHGLGEHKWLQALYEDREQWVPVYLKDTFFAGMIPIKENETSNMFFDGYVHKHSSFKEFLDKYDLAIQRKHLKEAMGDLESKVANYELRTRSSFELQLSKFYTKEIFKKFQSEVEGMQLCFNTRHVSVNGPILTYLVKERVELDNNRKDVRSYEVLYETTRAEIRCICSLFNFNGYLCRHALSVLNYNGIEEIPSQYILPRWGRNYKSTPPLDHSSLADDDDDDENDSMYRYNNLYKLILQVVEEGAKSQERYNVAIQALGELFDKFNLVDNGVYGCTLDLFDI